MVYALRTKAQELSILEATVAARDLTITKLRESLSVKNIGKNGAAAKIHLLSTEDSKPDYTAGSGTATTTFVHHISMRSSAGTSKSRSQSLQKKENKSAKSAMIHLCLQ